MGTEPGTIKQFSPDEVTTVKQLAHLSLHETDILKVIEIAKQLGDCPETIVFFGIEPEKIELRMELSQSLIDQLGHYIEMIKQHLK